MYIVEVLIESVSNQTNACFSYLSEVPIDIGVRVSVLFNRRVVMGYVEGLEHTDLSKEEIEDEYGYKFQLIKSVIDDDALLNPELQLLCLTLSKLTLASKIDCIQAMLPPQLKPKSRKTTQIKYVTYVKTTDVVLEKCTTKQKEVYEFIKMNQPILLNDIPCSRVVLDKLIDYGVVYLSKEEVYRKAVNIKESQEFYPLTPLQKNVVDGILGYGNVFKTALLHGVTGSGKTEVYLHIAKEMLLRGKTVLMLVPEISLTPMMVEAFSSRFGEDVAILHSRLSMGEHYDEYRRIVRNEVKIVVGARSAIFAPIENLGVIILDEEHDSSYKQESTPRYYTHQIARIRGKYHNCPVILASATPSLETYSRALNGTYDLFKLDKRVHNQQLPNVAIISMVDEMQSGNYSIISRQLKDQLVECLQRGEQAVILMNKRGYSTYQQCTTCGEVVLCPHCQVSLTYHKGTNSMCCHYCNYEVETMSVCPSCFSKTMKFVGQGIQKIEEILEEEVPGAKVIRFDRDSTKKKDDHRKLLKEFETRQGNVLLGTQMIAKGLDFENVTFVGVLNADMSLNVPDFRCNERTYQLLSQVAGRAGRGHKVGKVCIQTFNPNHPVINCVKEHNFESFFEYEMEYRKVGIYPPFVLMTSLLIESKDEELVMEYSQLVKEFLEKNTEDVMILGPVDCIIYKMKDFYRKRITLKYQDVKYVYEVLNQLQIHYRKEKKVRVIIDVNPYSQI